MNSYWILACFNGEFAPHSSSIQDIESSEKRSELSGTKKLLLKDRGVKQGGLVSSFKKSFQYLKRIESAPSLPTWRTILSSLSPFFSTFYLFTVTLSLYSTFFLSWYFDTTSTWLNKRDGIDGDNWWRKLQFSFCEHPQW